MTPSTTLALLAALYHYKDINEPERLGKDMGPSTHNGSGAGADCSILDCAQSTMPEAFDDVERLRNVRGDEHTKDGQRHYED